MPLMKNTWGGGGTGASYGLAPGLIMVLDLIFFFGITEYVYYYIN